MSPENFVYWLQGYFELAEPTTGLTDTQTQAIKNHLALVFIHSIDPAATVGMPPEQAKDVQEMLNNIHNYSGPDPNIRYRC